tara:strand:+ start:28163 stop:28375 length:213 start_codon:yes stop_codon:yes gene_type:complete
MRVNVKFEAVWQIKGNTDYKVTKRKMVINSKTEKLLTYNRRGYFIMGKYLKKKDLNHYLEKIPEENNLPF